MWDIGSTFRRHWLEILWGIFAAANVVVIVALEQWETVPFHFVWVSLTLVYGLRVWTARTTGIVLAVVMAVTGAALTWTIVRGHEAFDELTEVPLMAAMFLAMAWHAHRRERAMDEAKRAAETTNRVLDRQRQFVWDASHELRTPITVARGHAELLRASVPEDQAAGDIDVILDELDRLSKLSDRLLTLAAADHPGFLLFEATPVEPFIEAIVRRWRPTSGRDWRSTVTVAGTVYADRERLRAAIDALIENAVHATSEGGLIELSAWAEGGTLLLEVSDDGRGIGVADLPSVFEQFARREPDRARGSGGTGLGLAIVKAIVGAHDGTVDVRSTAGRGTTFRIRLPGFREAPRTPEAGISLAAETPALG
jgi:signal transduction histidine kinase